ncbi:cysteine hydrolase [Devosia sp. ZB163]|uniref:cysteine hydrolase family protein n=1 Tax=Devosia sp. ZB163 TaxID=3025938 RepID=UPI00236119AD|nr:cysteine hydrolase [Devosia sp. ZB163]MDC9826277.1 cysteine hydrolase [Devosia sp. ZB163]
MHNVTLPAHIVERMRKVRGGSDHIYSSLDMSKVAHVCVDMQVGFVAEGAPIEVPMTREIYGTMNTISEAVRKAGGLNVFTRYTYDPSEKHSWAYWVETLGADQKAGQEKMAPGMPDWEMDPRMEIKAGDLIVDKTRFSALIPETCDMDAQLKAKGIDTLIITGTLTNCCCESTARDALQMGYKVIFMSDANATLSDEEHLGTLISMYTIFADVMDTPYLLDLIEKSSVKAAA